MVRMAHPTVRCVWLRRVHSVHHLRPGMDGAHGAPYGLVVWGVFRAPFTHLAWPVRTAHPTVRCVGLRRVHSVHHLRVCMIWCTECTLR